MRIEKPNIKTLNKLKKSIFAICAGGVIAIGCFGVNSFLNKEISSKNVVHEEISKLKTSGNSLNSSVAQYKKDFEKVADKATDKIINREIFIQFVGQMANDCSVSINKLAGGGTENNPPVSSTNFKVEIIGSAQNVCSFMDEIDKLKVPYMINEMSLRKNGEYLWLSRDIDGNKVLEWWNLKNISSPEKQEKAPEVTAKQPLGVVDLFGTEDISLYFDIDFISVEIKG